MPDQTPKVKLLKFGEKNRMKSFQEGVLYMNTLEYFQKLECCELRGDKDEGLSAIYQAKGGTLSRQNDKGEFVPVGTIVDKVRYREKDSTYVNVFCMYALQFYPQKQYIDERNFNFGDTFVLILNPIEFLNRVKRAATQKGIDVHHKLVEYVDRDKHNGPMGPFRKFKEFSYQNEFRILVSPETQGPYILNIGDISDITEQGDLSFENVHSRVFKRDHMAHNRMKKYNKSVH